MRRRSFLRLVAAACLSAVVTAGCGDSDSDEPPQAPASQAPGENEPDENENEPDENENEPDENENEPDENENNEGDDS